MIQDFMNVRAPQQRLVSQETSEYSDQSHVIHVTMNAPRVIHRTPKCCVQKTAEVAEHVTKNRTAAQETWLKRQQLLTQFKVVQHSRRCFVGYTCLPLLCVVRRLLCVLSACVRLPFSAVCLDEHLSNRTSRSRFDI